MYFLSDAVWGKGEESKPTCSHFSSAVAELSWGVLLTEAVGMEWLYLNIPSELVSLTHREHTYLVIRCRAAFSCVALVGKCCLSLSQVIDAASRRDTWKELKCIQNYRNTIQHELCSSSPLCVLPLYQKYRSRAKACVGTLAVLVLGGENDAFRNAAPKDLPLLLMHVQQ